MVSNHKFNEKKVLKSSIELLKKGKIISLISDAGTPNLSDPGNILVKECIKQNIKIIPIPGASAVTTAMSISGFDHKFLFYGFLPKKVKELEKVCKKLNNYNFSIIFFITAKKINFYLTFFKKFFLDREVLIAREMTKIHESFYRGNIEKIDNFESDVKGEITVVLSKKKSSISSENQLNNNKLSLEISRYLKRYSLKDVVKLISDKNNLPKKKVYELCLKIKKK